MHSQRYCRRRLLSDLIYREMGLWENERARVCLRGVSCKCLAFDRSLARRLRPVSVTGLGSVRASKARKAEPRIAALNRNLVFEKREKEKREPDGPVARFVRSPDRQKSHILITGAKCYVSRWVAAFLCELRLPGLALSTVDHSIFCREQRRKIGGHARLLRSTCWEAGEKKRKEEISPPARRRRWTRETRERMSLSLSQHST